MKKRHLFLALLPALCLAANGQRLNRAPSTDGYELVFSDEFNGTALDTQVWNVEVNGDGGGNNELQYYARGNVKVADGALHITARRENYGNKSFTSGRINSMGKAAFKHGIVQANIKLPSTANGLWPAFWLMGNDMNTGTGWPYCGEIDVLEAGGSQGIAAGTQDRFFISALHWGPYTNGQHPMYSRNTTASYSLQDGVYHLYTLVWDENKIAMYLDDQTSPYFEMNISDTSQQNSAGNYFHKQFFLLFNMAVGGNIPGIFEPSGITALANGERTMSVDYVRVYQKPDEKDYTTPSGSQGGGDPEVPEDTTTELGAYGSLSLDENNMSTFDFENATDFVVIGASQGVIDQMGDRIRADYSVDDVNNFLYVWENTYTTQETIGLNSFGLDEPWNSFRVNSVGWSGLGYASSGSSGPGKDMSMLDEDGYILHLALRGTDPLMHTAQAVYVGAASFTLGAAPFVDGNKTLPVLGDYKRDGRWCSFDIPVSVLKSLGSPLYPTMNAVKDNVLYFLSGGNSGAQLQFDNIFFYKNPNVNTDVPDEDTTTQIGQYATRSLDGAGQSTFDFDDGYDYVVIGASQGVMDQMGDRIRADYSVDNVKNFLYVWEGTYTAQETSGVNSFGLNEPWNSYRVNAVGWSGLGYASQGTGKDLTMLDGSYYLHFAMRGTDLLRHTSHTVGVGSAQFVIGNATTGPVMLGDFKRDGQWYSFDIPFSLLREMAGDPFEGNGSNYLGNVLSILSGGNEGAELQFDNVFFYRRHSDDGQQPGYDPELGRFGSKSLDDQGQPTFDLAAHTDYVLIALGAEEANQIKDRTLADYRVDDRNHFLYIWDGTYTAGTATGVNSFGYQEGYSALTVGSIGWSGLGFASTGGNGTGKDLSMIDDSYTLHMAFKGTDTQHATHAIGVGGAHFALGQTPFVDGGNTYGLLGDFKRDGEWYSFDIPFSEIASRANPVFANATNYVDNVISILSGGVAGVDLNFDAIFFYRDKDTDGVRGDLNDDGIVDIDDVNIAINIILGNTAHNAAADLNGDGAVDVDDMNALINIVLGNG
ncbi:MAG: glycoside hydrolase family 16 protein [Muribaculaceae bacterium]|nr:glycoside hydrolase family 16 protein [Muribaculaceae bacterium]